MTFPSIESESNLCQCRARSLASVSRCRTTTKYYFLGATSQRYTAAQDNDGLMMPFNAVAAAAPRINRARRAVRLVTAGSASEITDPGTDGGNDQGLEWNNVALL